MGFAVPLFLAAIVAVLPPHWSPTAADTFQWDLEEPIPITSSATVYDVDYQVNSAALVAALHRAKKHVICYIDVGSWESYRPDAKDYPRSILGKVYPGYPDERYVDIRQIKLLGPILVRRFEECKAKGFDGIEPDNIDSYSAGEAVTGFPLTAADARNFDYWLIAQAHARGLSIGQKNDPDQAAILVSHFDWALTEECFYGGFCDEMVPYDRAHKKVFNVEYAGDTSAATFLKKYCVQNRTLRYDYDMSYKDVNLDPGRLTCAGRLDPPPLP
jgi:hypothetical protein